MLSQLMEDMKSAMRSGNKAELSALRNIIGKLKAQKIDKGEDLTEEECLKILKTASKQLKDSIQQYQNGGREDLVEKEAFELSIVEKYLPESMSENEVRNIVTKVIKDLGAASMKDMGRVMGTAIKATGGKADGKLVQQVVQEVLGA